MRTDLDPDFWHTWTRQPGCSTPLHIGLVGAAEAVAAPETLKSAATDKLPVLYVPHTSEGSAAITLRDYQREAISAIDRSWNEGHTSPLMVLPTGTGKTIIAAAMMGLLFSRRGARSLFLAHRKELLDQTAAKMRLVSPCRVGIVQGKRNELSRDITIGSIQTVGHHSGARLQTILDAGPYDLIVCDEGHHAVSTQWIRVLNALREQQEQLLGRVRLFGMTATPGRADGTALDRVFDDVAFERNFMDMVRDGWLVPPRGFRVTLDVDLDRVATRNGDFVSSQLGKVMNTPLVNEAVVRAWQEYGHDRKTLAFAVDVAHAHALRDCFSDAGYTAEALDGKTKPRERERILQRFRDGEVKLLINCEVLTEGYDDPSTEAILFARPTQSQALYIQSLGRGLLLWPGKTECLAIDCVGNTERHKPIQLANLAGLVPENAATGRGGDGDGEEEESDDPEVVGANIRGEEVSLTGRSSSTRYQWCETSLGWVLQIPRIGYYLVAWTDTKRRTCTIRFFDRRPGRRDDPPRDVLKEPIVFEMAYGLVEAEMDRFFNARNRRHSRRRPGEEDDGHVPHASFVDLDDGLSEDMFLEQSMLRDAEWRSNPASAKQAALLVKLGVKQKSLPQKMGEASDLIDILQVQKDAKMRVPATVKQLGYLRVHGFPVPPDMTKGAAAKIIWRHRKGFLKPPGT